METLVSVVCILAVGIWVFAGIVVLVAYLPEIFSKHWRNSIRGETEEYVENWFRFRLRESYENKKITDNFSGMEVVHLIRRFISEYKK